MGKAVSKKNIARAREAHETSPDALGPQLAIVVYRNNLPASAISTLLRVSLPTLYRWFYGVNDVDLRFRARVARLLGILEGAAMVGRLPAHGDFADRVQTLVDIVRANLATPPQQSVE